MAEQKFTLSSYEPVYVLSKEIEIPEETIRGAMLDNLRAHYCKDGEEPKLTDAWINAHTEDFETVEQFRIVARYHLYREAQKYQRYQDEDAVCAELATRLVEEVPQDIIEEAGYASQMRFDQYLRENGLTKEEYCAKNGLTIEELDQQTLDGAIQGFKEDAALGAWAEHEGLTLDSDDIYKVIPGDTREEKLETRRKVEANGGMAGLEQYALKVKAMEEIMKQAFVKRSEYGEYVRFTDVNPEVAQFMKDNPDLVMKY